MSDTQHIGAAARRLRNDLPPVKSSSGRTFAVCHKLYTIYIYISLDLQRGTFFCAFCFALVLQKDARFEKCARRL